MWDGLDDIWVFVSSLKKIENKYPSFEFNKNIRKINFFMNKKSNFTSQEFKKF